MTDICLVSPPSRSASATVPVGLLYLHAWLTHENIACKIVDIKTGRPGIAATRKQMDAVARKIIEQVKILRPRYIGLPCYTPEFWDVISLCRTIKKNHDCPIIIGGLHVSIKPEDFFFEGSPVDIAVAGDGQYPLVEIIRRLDAGQGLGGVEGVVMRSKEGGLLVQGSSSFNDWDTLPNPDYSQLDMNYYAKPHMGIIRNLIVSGIHIFTTIGCPFSCTFCANRNRKVKYRPISKVLDEIEGLRDKYNIDSFYILDDTFMIKKPRVVEFVEGLKSRKIDLIWAMETRVNILDEEMARLISGANCIQVDFGVESGSDEALRRMKKGITEDQIVKCFDLCRKYNLRTYANFMFNTPGETAEDAKKTLQMMGRIRPTRVAICLTVPFPGTAIYRNYVNPPLTKEDYKIYNADNLFFKVVDPRFYMASHRMNLTSLRIRATIKANRFRSIIDYTLNPAYWKAVLKSRKKLSYLKVITSDLVVLSIERIKKVIGTYYNSLSLSKVLTATADTIAAAVALSSLLVYVAMKAVFQKKQGLLKGKRLLILDMAYTLEAIRKRQLHESITCRDLEGYFEHVWSVHPLATVIPPANEADTYGKPVSTPLAERHTIVEGKVGRYDSLRKLPALNFALAQWSLYLYLSRLIAGEHISMVRAGEPYYLGLLGLALSRAFGIPFVIRIGGNYDDIYKATGRVAMPRLFRKRWIEKIIEKVTLPRADLVAGANQNNLNFALKNGARKECSTVFRYGNLIHSAHYKDPAERPDAEELLARFKLSGRKFAIYIGRLEAVKRPDHVLFVLSELKKRGNEIACLIAGDGRMRKELEQTAAKLGISGDVAFVGNRDQEWLARVIPKASVALSPHTGRALTEAALGGVPIVAYNVDWQPELIKSGETGELVEYGDWKSMARAAERFLSDEEYSRRMGQNVRRATMEMMDPEKLNDHERNEYNKLFARFYK